MTAPLKTIDYTIIKTIDYTIVKSTDSIIVNTIGCIRGNTIDYDNPRLRFIVYANSIAKLLTIIYEILLTIL